MKFKFSCGKKLNDKLNDVLAILEIVVTNQRKIMAQLDEVQAYAAQIDAATNEIAADLQALKDQLAAAGSLTPESKAVLDSVVARLTDLGAQQ